MIFKDLKLGFFSYGKAFVFLFKHKLWYYLVFPLLIWLLLFWLNTVFGNLVIDWVLDFFCRIVGCPQSLSPTESMDWWDTMWAWTKSGVDISARTYIRLHIGFFAAILAKYMTIILLSPILTFLSEATEKAITGNEYPFSLVQTFKDIWRGVVIALRNMFIEFGLIFLVWWLSLYIPIPGFAEILSLPLWFLGYYFIGFSMMDYTNERRRLKIGESIRFVRKNKGLAIGIGWTYAIILWSTSKMSIGWVGLGAIGLMFAPILACVASTLAIHEKVDLNANPHARKALPDSESSK